MSNLTQDRRAQEIEAAMLPLWGKACISEIAKTVGSTDWTVRTIAKRLGLPPTIRGTTASPPLSPPLRPRGFTAGQIAWAEGNPDDPEARMILVMRTDPAAGRKDWAI